jgi:hypothetical protein
MMRSVLLLLGLCGVLAGCSWGSRDDAHPRISPHALESKIAKAHGVRTVCSRHTKDGRHWGCLVGDGMDPECYVIDVSESGKWSIEDKPRSCHYP